MTRFNKSKTYVLPILDSFIKSYSISTIQNTYLFTKQYGDKYFSILYSIKDEDHFGEYINVIKDLKLFKDLYKNEENYVILLNYPDDKVDDFKLIQEGKYSKLSQDAKVRIYNFISTNSADKQLIRDVFGVLYKTDYRKQQLEESLSIVLDDNAELTSIPIVSNETLNLEEYERINIGR